MILFALATTGVETWQRQLLYGCARQANISACPNCSARIRRYQNRSLRTALPSSGVFHLIKTAIAVQRRTAKYDPRRNRTAVMS